MNPEHYPVYIMRRYWNGLWHIVDWPKAHLSLDFDTGDMTLQAPKSFPIDSLPMTLSVDQIRDVRIVPIGDRAIRFILFFVLLGIPYSITRWIRGGVWEMVITAAFVLGDFILASGINRWVTIPAIHVTGMAGTPLEEQHIHLMGQGWQSPRQTQRIAQRMVDFLVAHRYRGLVPDVGDEQHWRRTGFRMIALFGCSTLILIVTGVSMLLSDLLMGY